MSIQTCSSSLKAENYSGSAPFQVFLVDEHGDIGPLLTVRSRLHPQAEAIMGARGQNQETHECYRDVRKSCASRRAQNTSSCHESDLILWNVHKRGHC